MTQITCEIVRELLHYSPVDGVFSWRKRERRWFKTDRAYSTWNSRYAGKRAGYVWKCHKSDYQLRQIKLFGKHHSEHRLAWLYMTGEIPDQEIDHKNRDATDNKWNNLKDSGHAQNCRNRSMRKDNSSGITGVSYRADRKKWRAHCCVNGKRHHLGTFSEIDEAAMEVLEFRSANGFTKGHGMEVAKYLTV